MIARVQEAVCAYNALSPVDRALLDSDQRRSFVRGQSGRDPGPDVLAEEVRRLRAEVDSLNGRVRSAVDGAQPLWSGYVRRLEEALEPFGELSGEGDEDFPDSAAVTVSFGRTKDYSLTLGDLRRAATVCSSPDFPTTEGRRANPESHTEEVS